MNDKHFEAAKREFTEYFARNYPGPNTIIYDPYWHAPKIFRAALSAVKRGIPPVASTPNCGACPGDGTTCPTVCRLPEDVPPPQQEPSAQPQETGRAAKMRATLYAIAHTLEDHELRQAAKIAYDEDGQ